MQVFRFVCLSAIQSISISTTYRVSHTFENDIVSYITLNWLEIPKCPLYMIVPKIMPTKHIYG
jgi:hypothetical protein